MCLHNIIKLKANYILRGNFLLRFFERQFCLAVFKRQSFLSNIPNAKRF